MALNEPTLTQISGNLQPDPNQPPTPVERLYGPPHSRVERVALVGLFALAVFYTLYFARDLLLPIFLALLLNMLLRPVVKGLRRLSIPEPIGAALVVLGLFGVVMLGMYQLSTPAAEWLERGPRITHQLEFKLGDLRTTIDSARRASKQIEELAQDSQAPDTVVLQGPSLAEQLLTQTQVVVVNVLLIMVLLYFFLATGRFMMDRIVSISPRLDARIRIAEISGTIQRNIAIYLATITVINAGLAIAVYLVMLSLGMPNPALWGAMAGILNFIPYLGAAVTGATIALVAVLTFQDWHDMLLPPVIFFSLTTLEGHFITPMMLSRRLTLNPVAVLLSLIFWGWLWGIPGALLAVPILAAFKIICDATPALQGIGGVLGGVSPLDENV